MSKEGKRQAHDDAEVFAPVADQHFGAMEYKGPFSFGLQWI